MNRSQAHRTLWVSLAACLALVGLSQCRLVDDSITGLDLKHNAFLNGRSDCVHRCNDAYKDALEAEQERYQAALRACGSDSECRDRERDTHKQTTDQIHDAKKVCKNSCYNEGGGTGGQ